MKKKKQRFPDSQMWSLDATFAQYMLPRLRRFKEVTPGHPVTKKIKSMQDWHGVLDEMIFALEFTVESLSDFDPANEEKKYFRARRGMRLMAEYWFNLWT